MLYYAWAINPENILSPHFFIQYWDRLDGNQIFTTEILGTPAKYNLGLSFFSSGYAVGQADLEEVISQLSH